MKNSNKVILRERKVKTLFFILLQLLIAGIVLFIPNMLLSVVLGVVTYYLLLPLVDFLELKGFSRGVAASIPFFSFAIIVTLFGIAIFPFASEQLDSLRMQLPTYLATAKTLLAQFQMKLGPFIAQLPEMNFANKIESFGLNILGTTMQNLPTYLSAVGTISFLAPLFGFFLLLDGKSFYRSFLSMVPNNLFELMVGVNFQIHQQMGRFIRARFFESLVISLIVAIGLLAIDFPYVILLSLFAGLLNLIPYLGPIIGALPAIGLCLVDPNPADKLLAVVLIYVLAQVIDTLILVPIVVARIVNLHPVTVILSVIIGAQILGIIGIIICIPIASALKIFLTAMYRHLATPR